MSGGAQSKRANDGAQPRLWAVASPRAGENSQILALAERLGERWARKDLEYNRLAGPLGIARLRSRLGIDVRRSDPLAPPWPDLVISAGVRNEPVCRWIRRQNDGRTRLVFLGRTWAPADRFDLIVTTPQYRLPRADNILHNLGTLHAVTHETLEHARRDARQRFADYPEPRIGALIGGDSGPSVFGARAARRLAGRLNELRRNAGGSVLVTTSKRTTSAAAEALERALDAPRFVYRWRDRESENPYFAILAIADLLVVTGDSVAMMSEAAATGKPVYLFDPAESLDRSLRAAVYRGLMRWGPKRLSRDVGLFHAAFRAGGHGVWLGETATGESRTLEGEIARTVERVRGLLR